MPSAGPSPSSFLQSHHPPLGPNWVLSHDVKPALTTSGILLISRQVMNEVCTLLYKKPYPLEVPYASNDDMGSRWCVEVSDLMSTLTLAKMESCVLRSSINLVFFMWF
jgi:hypothetical protein